MMLTILFVIYASSATSTWSDRLHRRAEDVFSDRPIQAAITLWGLTVLAIFYFYNEQNNTITTVCRRLSSFSLFILNELCLPLCPPLER
jgi:hypothetical protein